MKIIALGKVWVGTAFGIILLAAPAYAAVNSIEILRDALFGAGVGAISAGVSGGKAGKGALIGAGTQVLGKALLGILSGPSAQQSQSVDYSQPATMPAYNYQPQVYQAPVYQQNPAIYQAPAPVAQQTRTVYTYDVQPVYTQPAPVYYASSYEDPNKRIIKQGLMGAGVGAISAGASGGKAGSGALIGAGTNVLGSALLELLTN